MRRILRRREIVPDLWRHLGEDGADVADALIVPFAALRENAEKWRAFGGRLGARLAPADKVEDLSDYLPRLDVVAVEFPSAGDGRGYSHARLLRDRYKFAGELRAVGHVKLDQLFLMTRVGIDTFELSPGIDPETALLHFNRYSVAYQPGASNSPLPARRFG